MIHPFVAYYLQKQVTRHTSFLVILTFSYMTLGVHPFQRKTVFVFLVNWTDLIKIHCLSDGAALQYKNVKYLIQPVLSYK
jgi:hypothetical protein